MARTQKVLPVAQPVPSQRSGSSTVKRSAKPVVEAVPVPKVETSMPVIAGLARYVAINRRIAGLTALKKQYADDLKPLMFEAHRVQVQRAKIVDPKKLVKTLQACEGTGTAGLQLREKRTDSIPDDAIAAFTKAKLPLRFVPSKTIVNPKYAGSPDKNDDLSQLDRTIAALTKLIAENPQSGIPTDFLAETEPLTYADEGTLLKALNLSDKHAKVILPLIADVVVVKGDISEAEYNVLMDPKADAKADKKAAEIVAERGDIDTEEYPSSKGSKKHPRLRVVN